MPAAGKFDDSPDSGFVHAYDARAAKRQLQISIGLVLVLAFAAAMIGFLAQLERPQGRSSGHKYADAATAQFSSQEGL